MINNLSETPDFESLGTAIGAGIIFGIAMYRGSLYQRG